MILRIDDCTLVEAAQMGLLFGHVVLSGHIVTCQDFVLGFGDGLRLNRVCVYVVQAFLYLLPVYLLYRKSEWGSVASRVSDSNRLF